MAGRVYGQNCYVASNQCTMLAHANPQMSNI